METSTAETIVKVYAVLAWIGALFAVIGALFVMALGGLAGSIGMMGRYGGMYGSYPRGLFSGLGIVIGIFLLIVAVLYVIAGFGLWGHKNWARILALILSVLSLFSFPFGTIIGALGIWLFGFEPAVIGLFAGAKPLVATVAAPAPVLKAKSTKKAKK